MNFTVLAKSQKGANVFYSSGFKEELNVSGMYIPFKTTECFALIAEKCSFFPSLFFKLTSVFISCVLTVLYQKGGKFPDLRNVLLSQCQRALVVYKWHGCILGDPECQRSTRDAA